MHRSSVLFALASASLVAAQGFSAECTDISLNNSWLVATCSTGNGDEITSSVFLNSKVGNDGGNLTWKEDGAYRQSCKDCTLVDSSTLQCSCPIASLSSYHTTSLNLEEHIANYEGHLLSNQTGEITTVPENSDTPVPSDFGVKIELDSISDNCSRIGATISLNMPTDCYYLNIGAQDVSYTSGVESGNYGWEIVAYSDKECTSELVHTFTSDENDQCVAFNPKAMAWSVKPLWNADY